MTKVIIRHIASSYLCTKLTTMKRILLAFDAQHFSEAVFEFAKELNLQQPIHVTGVFLPTIDYVELLYSYGGVLSGPMYVTEVVKTDTEVLKKHVTRFKSLCDENGIKYDVKIGEDKQVTAYVADHTRFADMLVLSSKSLYNNLGDNTREEYIADVMHKSECPVVLIPDNYKRPDSVVIAYDGSEQSVFAVKQFIYQLPHFTRNVALFAFFEKGTHDIPYRDAVEQYASLHFKEAHFYKLKLDSKEEMEKWLEHNGHTILVAGAHSRSMLSEMFKGSFINEIVHQHKIPVFIAHK